VAEKAGQLETAIHIRLSQVKDYGELAALWRRINRELAPADMIDAFELYIESIVHGELRGHSRVFSPSNRSAFWVVTDHQRIIGCFGIERIDEHRAELRRMYLDKEFRGRGLAQKMLQHAESKTVRLQYAAMVLSSAEIQTAALAFYRKSDYRLVRTERADQMSNKTVGSNLQRYHFEKKLQPL